MKIKHLLLTTLMAAQAVAIQAQTTAAHFDMSLTADGKITEAASGQQFTVASQLPAFSVDAIQGQALRFLFGSAYANGYLFTIDGTEKLPRGEWCLVTAVLDKASNTATLYLNGASIGTARMSRSDIVHGSDRREPVLISFSPDASTPKGLQHIPYPVKAGNQEFTITLDVIIR